MYLGYSLLYIFLFLYTYTIESIINRKQPSMRSLSEWCTELRVSYFTYLFS